MRLSKKVNFCNKNTNTQKVTKLEYVDLMYFVLFGALVSQYLLSRIAAIFFCFRQSHIRYEE